MKQLRYYCEYCGAEVKQKDKVCHKCGRFFSAVKCPRCGNSGSIQDFRAGCPVCGYSGWRHEGGQTSGPTEDPGWRPRGHLAPWVYALSFGLLLLVCFLLWNLFSR